MVCATKPSKQKAGAILSPDGRKRYFVVHGGLFSRDGVTLEEIQKIDRIGRQPGQSGLMCELLWTDPQDMPGRGPSKRVSRWVPLRCSVAEHTLPGCWYCIRARRHQAMVHGERCHWRASQPRSAAKYIFVGHRHMYNPLTLSADGYAIEHDGLCTTVSHPRVWNIALSDQIIPGLLRAKLCRPGWKQGRIRTPPCRCPYVWY